MDKPMSDFADQGAAQEAPEGCDAKAVVEAALRSVKNDPGAVFEPEVITAWRKLHKDQLADFVRLRVKAKGVHVPIGILDRALGGVEDNAEEDNGNGRPLELNDVVPLGEAVNGEELLGELSEAFRRYVALPEHTDTLLALWTLHTYSVDLGNISPLLGILSPQKRCGKTTLLTLLGGLVNRPLSASNISPSAVFRTIEKAKPTLLIDEADSFLKDNEELRGVLNSGHTKAMAYVIRTVGDDYEPRQFSTWAPKALALIGKLPDTLHDRALVVPMRRKLPNEAVASLRGFNGKTIRRKCARWVADNESLLAAADPIVPQGLNDRAADNWRPLLAIAELAGGEWAGAARSAAALLSSDESDEAVGVMLLEDIRELFTERKTANVFSEALVNYLDGLDHRPWAEWNKGKPITKNQVARLLRSFRVKPKNVRIGAVIKKGYEHEQFEDAFSRYLSPNTPFQNVTPLQPSNDAGFGENENVTQAEGVTDEKPPKPAPDKGCYDVAFQEPPLGEKGEELPVCRATGRDAKRYADKWWATRQNGSEYLFTTRDETTASEALAFAGPGTVRVAPVSRNK